MPTIKKDTHRLYWFIGLQLFVLIVSSFFITHETISLWYDNLNKPHITPGNAWFFPIWLILYILIGVAGWLIWKEHSAPLRTPALTLWYVQTMVNFLWTYIFFHFLSIGGGLLCIIVLDVLVFMLLYLSFRISKWACLCLCPYFLWLCFATLLNFLLFLRN